MDPWKNIGHLSKSEILDLQNKKLQHFVKRYLYPFSPHYRKIFDQNKVSPNDIKTVNDLQRLPFTSKLDLLGDESTPDKPRDFILQPNEQLIKAHWSKSKLMKMMCTKVFKGAHRVKYNLSKEFRPVFMTFTTGTTNRPTPFVYTNHDIQNLHVSGSRMMRLFGSEPGETIVNMFPYAPHLAFWQVVFGGFESCCLVLSTGGGKVMGTEGNIKAIMKMKPSIIIGVPSYVYHVFRVAKESGEKFDFVKKVIVGASKITNAFKIRIAELLESMGATDVSVFGTYGFTESRTAWGECPTPLDKSSGYFLYPDKEIFEIVDPDTGEVKKEGEDGELVYTSLDSRGSAVLRYRTGDFVKGGIVFGKNPYNDLLVPRISSDITRLSNTKDLQLSKVKGSLINLNHFTAILSDSEMIDEWQIELRKRNDDPFDVDELVVYACAETCTNKDQLALDISKEILEATEVKPNAVNFISMQEMVKRLEIETANKEKRIIDTRPKNE